MELVSCIIPTYKRADMLNRAINSVITQTYQNIEILVVDDNEPGSSESEIVQRIVNSYSDKRIRYVSQRKHINGAVARNEGIKQSRGRIIAFLDDDDEWLSNKIEHQVNYLMENKNVNGVTCLYSIYKNGKEVKRCNPYTKDNLQFKVLAHQVSMYTSTFLCRKEAIVSSGGFNPELQRNQDLQMFTDFLNSNTIVPLPEYMVILHEDSDINRKGIQKTIEAKEIFFAVERKIIEKYDKAHKKRIYSAHYFDIVINALRAKEYKVMMKYIFKIGVSLAAYRDALHRIVKSKNIVKSQ